MTIKEYARPMTVGQINSALNRLGSTTYRDRVELAKLLGIGDRTLRGFTLGEYPVPKMLAILLRYAIKTDIKKGEEE